MADFSDNDDLRLYQLAKKETDAGRKISWQKVWLRMQSCGKTQRQLQIRLKTLKRTYGTDLNGFPRQFTGGKIKKRCGEVRTEARAKRCTNSQFVVIPKLFASVPRQTINSPDQHTGEVTPVGVSAILAALPDLQEDDVFLDIGSGVGNIIAQVALETRVGVCIGIELQRQLARISETLLRCEAARYRRLETISVFHGDIRSLESATYAQAVRATILYANNLVFDPTSNMALEEMATSLPRLTHIVLTERVCTRHRVGCNRAFCSLWELRHPIAISVSWSSKQCCAYWYSKI